MQIKKFRGKEFINRGNEIEHLKQWVDKTPDEILWIYGPKSTGKTTLIEYVIEKELIKDFKLFSKSNYWIKYINFRRTMVGSYDSFINSFFQPVEDMGDFGGEISTEVNLGIIKLNAKLYQQIKNKEANLFNQLIINLNKVKKRKIIVIDEIQALEDIYYNGEKELLKEFLNFCVALTKELHLCHVIILSSNTIFIDKIYNDAKLKVTSRFFKVDHLDKETTFEYLKYKSKELNSSLFTDYSSLIYDYLGGCIPLLQRMIREYGLYSSLEEYLKNEVNLALSEIQHIFRMELEFEEIDIFKEIAKEIIKKSIYTLKDKEEKKKMKIINFMCEKEILFFDPLFGKIYGNNRLYEKALEKLI